MEWNSVPAVLRERLGSPGTGALVELLNRNGAQQKDDVILAVGDRFERRLVEEASKLRVEMAQGFAAVRLEMQEGLAGVRQEMHEGLAGVRQEMRAESANLRHAMATDRFELLKWAFIFWVGQFIALSGLVAVVIRSLKSGF